jgi:hypothetical protein
MQVALAQDRCERLFPDASNQESATCTTLLDLYGNKISDDELREQVSKQVYDLGSSDVENLKKKRAEDAQRQATENAARIEASQCGRLFRAEFDRDVCLWDSSTNFRERSDDEVRRSVSKYIEQMKSDEVLRRHVISSAQKLRIGGVHDRGSEIQMAAGILAAQREAERQAQLAQDRETERQAQLAQARQRTEEEQRASGAASGDEVAKTKTEAPSTPEGRRRVEQEELMNRPATGTGLYRCVGSDGTRNTRKKYDVRLGEYCGELTRQEAAKIRAEANRPPTDSEKQNMKIRANRMDHWDRCVEVGRVLRQANRTPREQYWAEAVIAAADVSVNHHKYIRERRVGIGMSECAVLSALGKPETANSTHTAGGRRTQLVYRANRLYVYTENGVVSAWQD